MSVVPGFELAEGSVGLVVCRPLLELSTAVVEALVPPLVPGSVSPSPDDEPKQAVASTKGRRPRERKDGERIEGLEVEETSIDKT